MLSNISIENQPLDVHCHGVGRFDFTQITDIKLQEIEEILSNRSHRSILTVYLPEPNFDDFLIFMKQFYHNKENGLFSHIIGISLEGPLLASHGGTPLQGVWQPSKLQWQQLAECGHFGLIYVIFSPDALVFDKAPSSAINDIIWLSETLLNKGVLPAAGHFTKEDPQYSAEALQAIYDVVAKWEHGPTITDHLYNDMPHNFKHAWRTSKEKKLRDSEIQALNLDSWNIDNLEEKLGIVPATMIRNAKKGHVKIAMNFDGEHVDLAIVKRTIEIVGAENFLMMTDSIESKRLAGRDLMQKKNCSLLYQQEDIVAAGSLDIKQQLKNMQKIGLTDKQIQQITVINPNFVLAQRLKYIRSHVETTLDI